PRLVLLDQMVLEQQRFLRRRDHDGLDVGDRLAEKARRDEEALVAALAEVLPDPCSQVLGLADVDHGAAGVLEQVHPRLGGNPIEDVAGQHAVDLSKAGAAVRRCAQLQNPRMSMISTRIITMPSAMIPAM